MIKKWFIKLLGGHIKLIVMPENKEREILNEMWKIDGIEDYLVLQRVAGYQLYGKTNDKRYLGYVDFVNNLLNIFRKLNIPDKDEETHQDDGYSDSLG